MLFCLLWNSFCCHVFLAFCYFLGNHFMSKLQCFCISLWYVKYFSGMTSRTFLWLGTAYSLSSIQFSLRVCHWPCGDVWKSHFKCQKRNLIVCSAIINAPWAGTQIATHMLGRLDIVNAWYGSWAVPVHHVPMYSLPDSCLQVSLHNVTSARNNIH